MNSTYRIYEIDGFWVVGIFRKIPIGNGRTVIGIVKEIKCCSKTQAEYIKIKFERGDFDN